MSIEWILPPPRKLSLTDHLFELRGIKDKNKFLNATFGDLDSSFLMYGVDRAVKVLSEAIKDKKKIYIHGDFDVDGITATSLMWNFLYKDLNASVLPFIPNRFTDGYGLSEENIKKIIEEGGDLIISVDCGIKDIELVNKYFNKVDFIITDHHTIRRSDDEKVEGSKFVGEFMISSKAKAVVHPQLNPELPFKEICGAMVSWKVCSALNEYLKAGVDMSKYMDLASLGTVCDVMPLVDENRIVVKTGIERIRKTINKGLQALFRVSGSDITTSTAYHLGYVIGPRLNASGRLETAMDAVRLLTTDSERYALQLATKLNDLNKLRQDLTKEYIEIAENQLLEEGLDNKIHFLYGDGWPEGIVGLIAGRLTEKYNKPILIGSHKEGILKGSARSIPELNIADALKHSSSTLLRYGGHAQAAGFSLNLEKLNEFKNLLKEFADTILENNLNKKLYIDLIADFDDLSLQSAKDISQFEPFGNSNSTPLIALLSSKIMNPTLIGKDQLHLKFNIGSNTEFIFFNCEDRNALLSSSETLFDIAGHLEIDSWKGREKTVFKVRDIRKSE